MSRLSEIWILESCWLSKSQKDFQEGYESGTTNSPSSFSGILLWLWLTAYAYDLWLHLWFSWLYSMLLWIILCFQIGDFTFQTLDKLGLSSEVCFVKFPLGFCDVLPGGFALIILVLFYCLFPLFLYFSDKWVRAEAVGLHFLLLWESVKGFLFSCSDAVLALCVDVTAWLT